MRLCGIVLALLVLLAAAPVRGAEPYAGKTITMIINYPAGGPTDIEGRIVAQHLPDHLPGRPTIVVKNVGGAGGLIGSNQLGEAAPTGETMGFFTLDSVTDLLGDPAVHTRFSEFVVIAGVESPLVVYARRDTPPGLKIPADLMRTKGFKALSLNARNVNTVNQLLALDLLGLTYQAIPAYRGLREVETAILQNIGQLANTSLSGWRSSIEPTMGTVVMPLWQLAPRKDGAYPRSRALPDMPTFEEFYASVNAGKSPAGDLRYQVLRAVADPELAMFRVALMPPHAAGELVGAMRTAFVEMWKDPQFLADYTKAIKSNPILVTGSEGEKILAELAQVRPEVKRYLADYVERVSTAK